MTDVEFAKLQAAIGRLRAATTAAALLYHDRSIDGEQATDRILGPAAEVRAILDELDELAVD